LHREGKSLTLYGSSTEPILGSSAQDVSHFCPLPIQLVSAEAVAAWCQFVNDDRSLTVGRSSVCFDRFAQSFLDEHGELAGKRYDRFPVGELGVSRLVRLEFLVSHDELQQRSLEEPVL